MTHPALSAPALERLRAALGGGDGADPAAEAPPALPSPTAPGAPARLAALVRREGPGGALRRVGREVAARRAAPKAVLHRVARKVVAPAVEPLARRAATEALAEAERRTGAPLASLTTNLELLKGEVRALAPTAVNLELLKGEVRALAPVAANLELLRDEVRALAPTAVNQELLKQEVRALQRTLEELGMALAPGAGLAGAGARVAELRERVNGLDRRLRVLAAAPPPPPPPAGSVPAAEAAAPSPPPPGPAAPRSASFDYVGFERRFRGDPEEVLATLKERYGELLAASPPVLDVGCGRGELLSALAAAGIEAVGVDTDPAMVAEARARGLQVHQGDAVAFLRSRPEGSFGSIIATHVVEHLELDSLVELLELAATRLRPGGVLVAETPNPASLVVLGNSYVLDPTHVRPLHPSLLAFLCEGAGFADVRLRFYSPAEDYHLSLVDDPDAPPWAAQVNAALEKLNAVLFGPQEFAVVARTPAR